MTGNSLTALITGGTSGIGRATANKLAQLGIHVIVVGRNAERGEKTVAEIRALGGEADFISSNLRDASSAREVARRAVELGFQSEIERLKNENQCLRDWVERLEDLISEAQPLLWVYQAPSFKRALDDATDWELRAQELLRDVTSSVFK